MTHQSSLLIFEIFQADALPYSSRIVNILRRIKFTLKGPLFLCLIAVHNAHIKIELHFWISKRANYFAITKVFHLHSIH